MARPDIFHPRIVLTGDPQLAEGDGGCADDAGLVAALRRRGLHARWMSWDDPATLGADLVILRGVGDCAARREEFLAWTRQVRRLLNAPDVIAWNTDPRYLSDLQYAGVPTVSRMSRQAPCAAIALIYFGGRQSHAFGAGDAESVRGPAVAPDFELWDVGRAALRAAAERLSIRMEELLYARADVVGPPDDIHLVSLDLVAPQLGWRLLSARDRSDGQRQFALCVESALQRLGLGPLSHRRP